MTLIDQQNLSFWNELCGTGLARKLGIADDSAASLKRFDDWYFGFYPYLDTHIPYATFAGREVLEMGLGYGAVAQRLMEAGTQYHGLDIAAGPVAMARHRAALLGCRADIRQGSALAIPYPDATFDGVVTIGCLHHTGNLVLALKETQRVLKPGGRATIMLYSALSYRQWMRAPFRTFRRRSTPDFNWTNADWALRRSYDANREGEAAPATTFITAKEAKLFLGPLFRSVTITPRNIGKDFPPAFLMPRNLANVCFERFVGLDLYIECIK